MASQLAKLNEVHVALSNANMGITDIQFCLILLNALPASYEVLASTILASGAPSALQHSEIIACILNEEGRHASGSTSLNAARAAPIKGKGKGKDHSSLTCHYCPNKGHIKPNCRKLKKDEVDGKKKEEGSSAGGKLANSHVLVETMASIMEVIDNEISASLYAAWSDRWMLDSGATHHITPHRSDFSSYTPQTGSVCLGDKSAQDQIGVGSVIVRSPQGCTITLSNVLHVSGVQTCFIL